LTAFVSLRNTPVLRDAFDDLLKAPSLIFAKRAAFNNLNPVTYFADVLLIVYFIFHTTLDVFIVNLMLDQTVYSYHDSLLHLVAYHNAYLCFPVTTFTHLLLLCLDLSNYSAYPSNILTDTLQLGCIFKPAGVQLKLEIKELLSKVSLLLDKFFGR
jgi:hypothetical protein